MPPTSKLQKKMQDLAAKKKEMKSNTQSPTSSPVMKPIAKVPADVHVTATLMSGSTYTQSKRLMNMCNMKTVAESTYYTHQKKILPIIESCAQTTVENAKTEVQNIKNPKISIDSRWSSKRNGSQNTATAIETTTNKIISYSNTIKKGGKRNGDYEGSSNMMESAGIRKIAGDLKNTFDHPISVVHDGDNKSEKIFEELGVNVIHKYDKNHAMGSLKRSLEKAKQDTTRETKIKKPFYGVEGRVMGFAGYLIDNVDDPVKRGELWRNTPEHLTGNHEHCEHPDNLIRRGRPSSSPKSPKIEEQYYVWKKGQQNPALKQSLQTYCDKTANIICNVSNESSTNPNESINSAHCKYANKRIAFGNSYDGRIAIAVGNWNDHQNFTKQVLEETGTANYICPELRESITKECEDEICFNIKRKDSYERKKMNISRRQTRETYKSKKEGDYNENKFKFE